MSYEAVITKIKLITRSLFTVKIGKHLSKSNIIWVLASIAFFVILSQGNRLAGGGLDDSWRNFLGYATLNNLEFADKVVFTYGPAWFFYLHIYQPGLYPLFLISSLFTSVVFGLVVTRSDHKLTSFFTFLIIYWFSSTGFFMLLVLVISYDFLDKFKLDSKNIFLILWLAFISLSKFSFFVLILPILLLTELNEIAVKKKKYPTILLCFVSCFILAWLILGQNPLNIVSYIQNSLSLSSGYSRAMGLVEWNPDQISNLVIISLLFIIGTSLELFAKQRLDEKKKLIRGALLISGLIWFLFVSFKLGYVRSHFSVFGIMAVSILYLNLNGINLSNNYKKFNIIILILTITNFSSFNAIFKGGLGTFYRSISFNSDKLLSGYQSIRSQLDENSIIPISKTSTVDSYPWSLSSLIYGKYNYHGRPVPQSYLAYTPYLQNLNYRHLIDNGPDYILFDIKTIDNRFTTLMNGQSTTALYSYYDVNNFYFIGQRPGVLLKRRKNKRRKDITFRFEELDNRVGSWIDLPAQQGKYREAQIGLNPNLKGRLKSFILREEIVHIEVVLSNGKKKKYRFLPIIGKTKFLLSPIITNTAAFVGVINDEVVKVEKIRIQPNESQLFNEFYTLNIEDFNLTGDSEFPIICGDEVLQKALTGEKSFERYSKYNQIPSYSLLDSVADEKIELKTINISSFINNADSITFTAINNDPILYLNSLSNLKEKELFLKVAIKAPQKTRTQIFYTTRKQPNYSEAKSVYHDVQEGVNEIYIELYSSEIITNIRIDPGEYSGNYSLFGMDIWKPKSSNKEDSE